MQLPAAVKPAATAFVANILMALPAAAEPGKIFDFNLTLPIMVTEFLLLMVSFAGLVSSAQAVSRPVIAAKSMQMAMLAHSS